MFIRNETRLYLPEPVKEYQCDVVIAGSGIAGLTAALYCAENGLKVTVLTKDNTLSSSSSLAQGGIACVWEEFDSFFDHYQDTISAGYGFNNQQAVHILVEEGKELVNGLVNRGMHFDSDKNGLNLGQEGAHSHRRILHAGGDATGLNLVNFLLDEVSRKPEITIFENQFVYDLAMSENSCCGVYSMGQEGSILWKSGAVIFAGGGFGRLFKDTTQAQTNSGELPAVAYLHGAELEDLEFVQFHPTGYVGDDGTTFLITEALRGEGAYLVNEKNERFMQKFSSRMELSPRDVVSRAMVEQKAVFIDARHLGKEFLKKRFPTIYSNCEKIGYQLEKRLLPVRPVAHYTIGGIRTDIDAKTSVPGLFSCGEVATAGCHGANRLASNSLLEGLVFGRRAALSAVRSVSENQGKSVINRNYSENCFSSFLDRTYENREMLSIHAGVIRCEEGLEKIENEFAHQLRSYSREGVCMNELGHFYQTLISYFVVCASRMRKESRGVHCRSDFPQTEKAWEGHIRINRQKGIYYEENR